MRFSCLEGHKGRDGRMSEILGVHTKGPDPVALFARVARAKFGLGLEAAGNTAAMK